MTEEYFELRFPTRTSCIEFLEKIRWPEKPICPHCSQQRSSKIPSENRHKCNACTGNFSVTALTIFHNTHVLLHKWFCALVVIATSERPITIRKLASHLSINKDAASNIINRIQHAAVNDDQRDLMNAIIEAINPDSPIFVPIHLRRCQRNM